MDGFPFISSSAPGRRGSAAALVALSAACAAQPPAPEADADRRCLHCHGQPHIADLNPADRRSMVGTWLVPGEAPPPGPPRVEPLTGDEPATRPSLFVTPEALAGSPHTGVRCVECHEDSARLPHPARLNRATCATSCHTQEADRFAMSAHQASLTAGDPDAPTCVSCHGGHDVLRISDRKAPQHRLNSLFLCGDCHRQHGSGPRDPDPAARVSSYLDSVHAEGVTQAGLLFAATCSDCHDAHAVLGSQDPRSTVHRSQVPRTCGSCHEGVSEVYAESVHGRALADNPLKRVAVCTDCHTAHKITRASTPGFVVDVVNECGECHDAPAKNGDRVGSYYQTYHRSYHGQVTRLGSQRAARCSDCHGAHDIRPLSDPASRVSAGNLVETCARCHPGSNAKFVQFDPHANHRDRRNYPILHGVWLYFMIVMSTVFGFFGLHTLLWFARSIADRVRHGRPHRHAHGATAIRRFTTLGRVNHALVALTFFGLTATGIPLVFSEQRWATVVAAIFGGVEAAGLWHRFFAVLLIFNLSLHFIGLAAAFRRRSVPWYAWLFGPESLLPRWKDVSDCMGMFRWFFGRGRRPALGRWTYWEKFDYWAEVGGSFIIGGSGLLLWFPEFFSRIVPGWAFNVAMIVHGYEALLAIGFIFTIHFFNVHIRPGAFPVDEVIFTGSMPEEELREHRPEEYQRLVERGALESLRVPAPDPKKHRVWVLVAVVSVSVGLTLLALIILGGLNWI